MFKSLCLAAVCLLSHVSALGGCNSGDVNYNDSNDNNISRVNEVERSVNSIHTIVGGYNFKDTFTLDILDFPEGYTGKVYYFDNTERERSCPFNYDGGFGFLKSIQINYSSLISGAYLILNYYDINNTDYMVDFRVYNTLSNLNEEYQTIFFHVINSVYFEDNDYALFNAIFTHDDNAYVKTYNGYFTFLNGGYILDDTRLNIFGSTTWNNSLSYTFNLYSDNDVYINSYERLIYDVQNSKYVVQSDYLRSNNDNPYIYFNGVKLTYDSFNAINNHLGVFTFVPSTDTSDFEDLLFSIADTPLYFIVSLFNFEMLGINLYIALAGLLTLVIVIVIIRKIW